MNALVEFGLYWSHCYVRVWLYILRSNFIKFIFFGLKVHKNDNFGLRFRILYYFIVIYA